MSEIVKCPMCGKTPGWDDFNIAAKLPNGERAYFCCGVRVATGVLWNKYAAAMELARAAVWAGECEDQKDYMDDATSNRDALRSIVNLDLEANDEACRALERCEEVFGV